MLYTVFVRLFFMRQTGLAMTFGMVSLKADKIVNSGVEMLG